MAHASHGRALSGTPGSSPSIKRTSLKRLPTIAISPSIATLYAAVAASPAAAARPGLQEFEMTRLSNLFISCLLGGDLAPVRSCLGGDCPAEQTVSSQWKRPRRMPLPGNSPYHCLSRVFRAAE